MQKQKKNRPGPALCLISKTLQSRRVCFPRLTHPLAHINISQALPSPLSHISGVAERHDSPLFNANAVDKCIVSFGNGGVYLAAARLVKIVQSAAKAAVTPFNPLRAGSG